MGYITIFFLIVILYIVALSGKDKLKHKFNKLGDISGSKREHIIAALGQPNTASVLANGTHLLQWYQNDCHIGIVFDNQGNFIHVSDKTPQQPIYSAHID